MKTSLDKVEGYLKGIDLDSTLIQVQVPSALPMHLRERYQLCQARLFGRDWVLAAEADDWEAGTPAEYRHQVDQLSSTSPYPVALVLPQISSTMRSRLIQMNVPFIVPGTQIFLPIAMINLQETYKTAMPNEGKPLSPVAQVLVLHEILDGRYSAMASKSVAQELGYSEMAISKARSDLEANKLCELTRKGKVVQTQFALPPKALWEKAGPILRSPVRKRRWLQWAGRAPEWKKAGISALAAIGHITDDDIPTYAVDTKEFQRHLEQGAVHGCPDRHEAEAQVEIWQYDPGLLSKGPAVDFLSLYLSLQMNPDERVQADLSTRMEKFPWR